MTEHRISAALAFAASLAAVTATAAAQEGAYDADPYFADAVADPYATGAANTPPRASQGQTERAVPAPARALPRPRAAGTAPVLAQATYAPAPSASRSAAPITARTPTHQGTSYAAPADRPLTAYIEARTGWDGPRGANRDDGIVAGVTAGADFTIARAAGGRLFAGLLASVDLSTAERANASVSVDDTGASPLTVLTETPTSETRDVEVGGRLGWRTDRFGFYAMAALTNRKREAETVTTIFSQSPDPDAEPDAADAVLFMQDSRTTTGTMGLFADGWRVGAGVEARVVGPAYLHVGYRYSDYEGEAGERHQVLTGLGARF